MQAMEAMAVRETVVIVDWTESVLIWAWLVPEEMVAQQTVERAAGLSLGTAVQQPAGHGGLAGNGGPADGGIGGIGGSRVRMGLEY